MKLIDILVQELPKIDGWPNLVMSITQDNNGKMCRWKKADPKVTDKYWSHQSGKGLFDFDAIPLRLADDRNTAIVTREDYEAALAESKVPVWNGEGLPPVGIECEISHPIHNHGDKVRVICHDEGAAICRYVDGDKLGSLCQLGESECRPLGTEAERKREEAVKAMQKCIEESNSFGSLEQLGIVYETIAAGKIPGIKLED